VPVGKLPSWDTDTVRAAVERNPGEDDTCNDHDPSVGNAGAVHTEDFVIRVDSNRPFFISCSTLLGPSGAPP